MNHIVVDIEIQKTIEETPGGWDATDKLGVSCACVWEYQTQRMRLYGPDNLIALQELLLKAERISGYNIFNFDFPCIWGVSKRDWMLQGTDGARMDWVESLRTRLQPRTNDLLRRIWREGLGLDPDEFNPKTHGGWGLDAVSRATLGAPGKIGNGADAPKWYQAGQWAKLVNYCADDVALERDLTDFVDRYGYVRNMRGAVVNLVREK